MKLEYPLYILPIQMNFERYILKWERVMKFFNPNIISENQLDGFFSNGVPVGAKHPGATYAVAWGVTVGSDTYVSNQNKWITSAPMDKINLVVNNGPEGAYVGSNYVYYLRREIGPTEYAASGGEVTIISNTTGDFMFIPIRAWYTYWIDDSVSTSATSPDYTLDLNMIDSRGRVIAKSRPPYIDGSGSNTDYLIRSGRFDFVNPDVTDPYFGLETDLGTELKIQFVGTQGAPHITVSLDFVLFPRASTLSVRTGWVE